MFCRRILSQLDRERPLRHHEGTCRAFELAHDGLGCTPGDRHGTARGELYVGRRPVLVPDDGEPVTCRRDVVGSFSDVPHLDGQLVSRREVGRTAGNLPYATSGCRDDVRSDPVGSVDGRGQRRGQHRSRVGVYRAVVLAA